MKKRIGALLCCLLLVLSLVFSMVFLAENTHHECTDVHCHICAVISVCTQQLRTAFGAFLFAALALVCALSAIFAASVTRVRTALSPVVLRVRLLD